MLLFQPVRLVGLPVKPLCYLHLRTVTNRPKGPFVCLRYALEATTPVKPTRQALSLFLGLGSDKQGHFNSGS